MTELFLIAHKVRGEPAFDVAIRIECPLCHSEGCFECDDCGYWWEIPTSGHRAYAYHYEPLNKPIPTPPEGWQDHYTTRAEPSRLAQLKAMLPPAKPIHRRF